MTRKDFELIAACLKQARSKIESDDYAAACNLQAEIFANALAGTTERFDRARFLTACGAA